MIELRNLSIGFHNEELLNNVNLSVRRGETFVFVGPSGKGKSVLLKLVAGLIQPSNGEVFIDGQNLNKLDRLTKEKIIQKMGMLFQKNALFDSMSVFENLAFPLRETTKLSEVEIKDKVDFFLKEVGLTHAGHQYPDEISGGMQKRVGIARALILNPQIILYDDPTAGLDPITSKMIIELILKLNKEFGTTVLAITNDMNRAYQMANRMGMLIDQTLLITGSVQETQKYSDQRVQNFLQGLVANGA